MNDIIWLTMRRLRAPLILLILVYFASVFALVSVPGSDLQGNVYYLNFLEAAYSIAILSTTIGFGEVPYPFTDAQRLLVYVLIFPNVVSWLYAIGTILGLFIDPQFQAVIQRNRFARSVRWHGEPFFIVCGFGNTGSMVVRGLQSRGLSTVVVEQSSETVQRMHLQEAFAHIPALVGEPTDHRNLEMAGLLHPKCRGVIATTSDDHANLTIAITSKLLNPDLPVLARSENERVSLNLRSFGTDFVINPFAIFAERLYLALSSPTKYLVQDWLISVPGSELRELIRPPAGQWIVCGAGRFGKQMLEKLVASGMPVTVLDVQPERLEPYENSIQGRGTEVATLESAGIEGAVGLIACTGDDIDNLSIVMTARQLNPDIFVIARQDRQQHDALFDASGAHLVARRSLIVARRVLAVATTPLLQTFLQHLVREDERFAERTKALLDDVLDNRSPSLWVAHLQGELAVAIRSARQESVGLTLGHLTHNTRSETNEHLACVCLILERGAQRIFLPDQSYDLLEGDRLLFAGRGRAQREMLWALADPNLLLGYATGKQLPRGAIWRWLWRREEARKAARAETQEPS